jgi:hypothetical protein
VGRSSSVHPWSAIAAWSETAVWETQQGVKYLQNTRFARPEYIQERTSNPPVAGSSPVGGATTPFVHHRGEIRERSLGYGQDRIGLSMRVCELWRTLVNHQTRIVAQEKVAGSSPVGRPSKFLQMPEKENHQLGRRGLWQQ